MLTKDNQMIAKNDQMIAKDKQMIVHVDALRNTQTQNSLDPNNLALTLNGFVEFEFLTDANNNPTTWSQQQKDILLFIRGRCRGRFGCCIQSYRSMAAELKLSVSTIYRTIQKAIKAGLLYIQKRANAAAAIRFTEKINSITDIPKPVKKPLKQREKTGVTTEVTTHLTTEVTTDIYNEYNIVNIGNIENKQQETQALEPEQKLCDPSERVVVNLKNSGMNEKTAMKVVSEARKRGVDEKRILLASKAVKMNIEKGSIVSSIGAYVCSIIKKIEHMPLNGIIALSNSYKIDISDSAMWKPEKTIVEHPEAQEAHLEQPCRDVFLESKKEPVAEPQSAPEMKQRFVGLRRALAGA